MSPASEAACALLDELLRRGVQHLVVCPGSRSQALALAAADLERQRRIRLHVRIDERAAAFLALGIARESGIPAPVIVTSGSAVANLFPAVLEAHHSGIPMMLLTADRPPELRGVGASQTTAQPGFFGAAVRWSCDAPVPAEGDDPAGVRVLAAEALHEALDAPGPVHLNLPYREPLSGPFPEWWGSGSPSAASRSRAAEAVAAPTGQGSASFATPSAAEGRIHVLEPGPRTVVIAGAEAGDDAVDLAEAGGFPLVAEIVSGARYGRRLVHGYRERLRELGGEVERAVVFGHPTLSREVVALLSRPSLEVVALGAGEPLNLNGRTLAAERIELRATEPDRDWLARWRGAPPDLSPAAPDLVGLSSHVGSERRAALEAELAAVREPLDRELLVDAVWRASWPHDRLVFGSSRLVRVADEILPGKKVRVHSNRGLAGIDGTVSTALGVAAASEGHGVTRVLLGDLALLHDAGSLLLAPGEELPRIQVIVGNDGGGTIFDGLEVAGSGTPALRDRVLLTPQAVSFEALARAYGWEHRQATTRAELDGALTSFAGTPQLIEVPLAR